MFNQAKQDSVELYVFSAYRSFDEQQALKGQYTVTYGAGTANRFSADQGYAYRYGFALSYPKNNDYYTFESWHWRFIGVKLATDLQNAGKYFYNLDQREIDEYLVYIFD